MPVTPLAKWNSDSYSSWQFKLLVNDADFDTNPEHCLFFMSYISIFLCWLDDILKSIILMNTILWCLMNNASAYFLFLQIKDFHCSL